MSTLLPLPVYSDETLAALDTAGLFDLLIKDEDRVPRNVIDECARRGDAIVEHLDALLHDDGFWREGVSAGNWWLRLHAAMILGLVPGERAGLLLVGLMRRIAQEDDDNTQDWLAGYWPALFRNKPDAVVPALRTLCEDRGLDWYIRACALEAAVAMAQWRGNGALEEALARAARIAGDESEDWDLRLMAGVTLLNFPRDAYRALLEDLAVKQTDWPPHFAKEDVVEAYSATADKPEREGFRDPWEFYTPAAIARRQERWEKEDAETEDGVEDDESYEDVPVPYVRPGPKIGRNDPCPCGSGKKYKRCCMPVE